MFCGFACEIEHVVLETKLSQQYFCFEDLVSFNGFACEIEHIVLEVKISVV